MFKRNNIEKNRSVTNKLDANQPNNIAVTIKNIVNKMPIVNLIY
jgi:hypothetical protein